jgi:hypothetical protein
VGGAGGNSFRYHPLTFTEAALGNGRVKVPDAFRGAYEAAKRAGWQVVVDRSGHLRWYPPPGHVLPARLKRDYVRTPYSPSDYRGTKNSLRELKDAGVPVPEKHPKKKTVEAA